MTGPVTETATDADLPRLIAAAAEPLPDPDDPGFADPFDRFADARVVLLGEASHGTSEFYRARAAITRRLVERHGFTIVAVEADWPDAAAVDRAVRGPAPTADVAGRAGEPPFRRFPTWMWRNAEVAAFLGWLRDRNEAINDPSARAGFYGLDLYNMRGSITAVLDYLSREDPEAAEVARHRYGCLDPWREEPAHYGRAALREGYGRCEAGVIAQCRDLLHRSLGSEDGEGLFDAAQNARLVASAERYYRVMYWGGSESWNLRDTHMFETLEALLDARGPDARAVVWAHNSHIGDARYTDMGRKRGELNLGQLCRERWGEEAALVGFGTHAGTVAAASDWDREMEIKRVRPSREGSHERLCHESGVPRFLLDLREEGALRDALGEARLERFIGVIYRPESELMSHYARATLPGQFDAWVWFDDTRAVEALDRGAGGTADGDRVPDTFPFGL